MDVHDEQSPYKRHQLFRVPSTHLIHYQAPLVQHEPEFQVDHDVSNKQDVPHRLTQPSRFVHLYGHYKLNGHM